MKTKPLFFLAVVLLSAMVLVAPSGVAQQGTSLQEADNKVVSAEVTAKAHPINAGEYLAFLSAVAVTDDPYGLYNVAMANQILKIDNGGPDYVYSLFNGEESDALLGLTLLEAMRYCNWLGNTEILKKNEPISVPSPITEAGCYTIQNNQLVGSNPNAKYRLASFDSNNGVFSIIEEAMDSEANDSPLMMFGGGAGDIEEPGEEKKSEPITGSHGQDPRLTQPAGALAIIENRSTDPLSVTATDDTAGKTPATSINSRSSSPSASSGLSLEALPSTTLVRDRSCFGDPFESHLAANESAVVTAAISTKLPVSASVATPGMKIGYFDSLSSGSSNLFGSTGVGVEGEFLRSPDFSKAKSSSIRPRYKAVLSQEEHIIATQPRNDTSASNSSSSNSGNDHSSSLTSHDGLLKSDSLDSSHSSPSSSIGKKSPGGSPGGVVDGIEGDIHAEIQYLQNQVQEAKEAWEYKLTPEMWRVDNLHRERYNAKNPLPHDEIAALRNRAKQIDSNYAETVSSAYEEYLLLARKLHNAQQHVAPTNDNEMVWLHDKTNRAQETLDQVEKIWNESLYCDSQLPIIESNFIGAWSTYLINVRERYDAKQRLTAQSVSSSAPYVPSEADQRTVRHTQEQQQAASQRRDQLQAQVAQLEQALVTHQQNATKTSRALSDFSIENPLTAAGLRFGFTSHSQRLLAEKNRLETASTNAAGARNATQREMEQIQASLSQTHQQVEQLTTLHAKQVHELLRSPEQRVAIEEEAYFRTLPQRQAIYEEAKNKLKEFEEKCRIALSDVESAYYLIKGFTGMGHIKPKEKEQKADIAIKAKVQAAEKYLQAKMELLHPMERALELGRMQRLSAAEREAEFLAFAKLKGRGWTAMDKAYALQKADDSIELSRQNDAEVRAMPGYIPYRPGGAAASGVNYSVNQQWWQQNAATQQSYQQQAWQTSNRTF